MIDSRSAVITGRGALSAFGPGVDALAAAVRAGDPPALAAFPGATGPDAPLCYCLPPGSIPEGKRDEPASALAIAAAAQALAEAGLQADDAPLDDVGLVMSNVLGPSGAVESYIEALALKGPRSMKPTHFVDTILSMPGSRVGIALKLRGSTAVLGGSSPFELALGWLRCGREQAVVAGAAEFLSPKCVRFLRDLGQRSGEDRATLGQGAAFVVLESPARVRERGARAFGQLLGAGAASEPQTVGVPWAAGPDGIAFEVAMQEALADARLQPADISMIALAAGDAAASTIEQSAVERVVGSCAATLALQQPKQLFGEALGASAGLALLATLEALEPGTNALVNAFELGGAITSLAVARTSDA